MGEGPFFYCAKLVVKIPNSVTSIGPYWRDAYGDEVYDEGATICAKEGSYAQKYAKENGIPFILWEEEGTAKPEKPQNKPVYEVVLTEESTTITSADLQALVEINKTKDVVIKTPSGVVFTFVKGSMKMIDGKTEYDFGTELITDYAKVGKIPFTSAETAFRVNYNYDGELPGTASITIPVDAKWNGKTLYYYQIVNDGKVELKQNAVVSNGTYTISQNHCSDYIASTKELKVVNAPTETAPRTGDSASLFTLISMLGLAGTTVLRGLKKN